MSEKTGYKDRYGRDICVGDYVKFRTNSLTGRGIVVKSNDLQEIKRFGEYVIQDTRKFPECKRRSEGRRYPLYDDVAYTILTEKKYEEQ